MRIDAQIKGVQQTIAKLSSYTKEVQKKADKEIGRSAFLIESEAKKRSPIDTARLRSGIATAQFIRGIGWEVVVNAYYAPYVEFGTQSRVDVPPGLEGYAMQFKGTQEGGLGVRARPFLFPAFESERPKLLKKLERILNGGK